MKTMTLWVLAALFIFPTSLLAADPNTNSEPVLPEPEIAVPSLNASAEQKLPEIAQSPVNTEQNDSQKEAMASQIKQMSDTTATLSQTVDNINQQVASLKNQLAGIQSQNNRSQQQIKLIIYSLLALTLLMLVSMGFGLSKRRRQADPPVTPQKNESKVSQSEYDFMSSSEAIPAKLDLARAYMAMEDFVAARETLVDILNETNEEYHPEARSLLNKIKEH
ncbi:MAG: hypothetical protein JSR33_05350 [Proteobacteria bacterium]|nr:hypothetical protein [Pseudomonadota bacterium]